MAMEQSDMSLRTRFSDSSEDSNLSDPPATPFGTTAREEDQQLNSEGGNTFEPSTTAPIDIPPSLQCTFDEVDGICRNTVTVVNLNSQSNVGNLQIGDQYHIHITPEHCLTVLEEGQTAVITLPNSKTIRITVEGQNINKETSTRMENRILQNLSEGATNPNENTVFSRLRAWMTEHLPNSLHIKQIKKACIEITFASGSQKDMVDFEEKILSSQFQELLSDILVTEDVKNLANGTPFKLKIEILEEKVDEIQISPPLNSQRKQKLDNAMIQTAKAGDVTAMAELISNGGDPNLQDEKRISILQWAVRRNRLEMTQYLISKGAQLSTLDFQTGNTLLHTAVLNKNENMVAYLAQSFQATLEIGDLYGTEHSTSSASVDINAFNNQDLTALQMAANEGSRRMVTTLLQYGATTTMLDNDNNVYKCEYYSGIQAMIETYRRERLAKIMACIKDKKLGLEELKQIWQAPFDHNLRHHNTGDTPLIYACKCSREEVVDFLLQSAIYSSSEATKCLALFKTEYSASVQSVDSGLGKEPNQINLVSATNLRTGWNALHYTVNTGDGAVNLNIARMLINKHIDCLNIQDNNGQTLLHIASKKGYSKMVKLLLTKKIDVNIRNGDDLRAEDVAVKPSTKRMIRKVRLLGSFSGCSSTAVSATETSTEIDVGAALLFMEKNYDNQNSNDKDSFRI